MIASINGRVADKGSDFAIVEVGGMGFQVFVPSPFIDELRVGETVYLHTHLIVREDS